MATKGYGWHIHHEKLYEPLTEPIENRIKYVKGNKGMNEQATRLRLMRPVKDVSTLETADKALQTATTAFEKALDSTMAAHKKGRTGSDLTAAEENATKAFADIRQAGAAISALHRAECEPDCPWNGASIFAK